MIRVYYETANESKNITIKLESDKTPTYEDFVGAIYLLLEKVKEQGLDD